MGGRLILLAIVSLLAAGAAGVATAAAVVMVPTLLAGHDNMAPGSVLLMGAVLALAFGLLRPKRQQIRTRQTHQAAN